MTTVSHNLMAVTPGSWSVKALLVFASTAIPGFILFMIHDQDLHNNLSISLSALSQHPGYYGLCASFVTTLY
jgi:hypothetical protein